MRKANIGKLAGAAAAVAMLGALQAKADLITYDLTSVNLSGYSSPFVQVDVDRTSSTSATITFTALQNYLLTDGGSAGVNVNGAFTLGTITGTPAAAGAFSNGGAGNEDGYGSFNLTINDDASFTHAANTITFTITANGSTSWSSAANVLIGNNDGEIAAAHIGVLNSNSGAFVTTGFASDAVPVPEPTTVLAGILLLLPLGVSTIRVMRRGNRFA